jgi:hypothetical protein
MLLTYMLWPEINSGQPSLSRMYCLWGHEKGLYWISQQSHLKEYIRNPMTPKQLSSALLACVHNCLSYAHAMSRAVMMEDSVLSAPLEWVPPAPTCINDLPADLLAQCLLQAFGQKAAPVLALGNVNKHFHKTAIEVTPTFEG